MRAPAPFQGAPYSQAIKANGFVFVSGQLGLTAGHAELAGSTIEEQTRQVFDNLDAILSVPGIDLYSIGPNDFAQSLGYPGQPDHPEVVKTMQEISRRIRQAGRTMQADVMQAEWVSDMLLDAGRRTLSL